MTHNASSPTDVVSQAPSSNSTLHLHGRWLMAARGGWVAVAVFPLIVCIGSLPAVFLVVQTPCTAAGCVSRQRSPEQARTLQQTLGLSARLCDSEPGCSGDRSLLVDLVAL